jgi:hypothetical protein
MNERIKQLLEKARVQDYWSVDEHRYLVDYIDHEKFADLIIEDCAQQAALWYPYGVGKCTLSIRQFLGTKDE